MRVLAIDPGYERLGVAVMDDANTVIFSTCFQTSKSLPHPARLAAVQKEVERLIKEFKPEMLATEGLFFAKNQKTAMAVAETRGVILATAHTHKLEIYEYLPAKVKIAVTGYGASDKKQVALFVSKLVYVPTPIKFDDEYDAIAIGLTFFAHEKPGKKSFPQSEAKRIAKS